MGQRLGDIAKSVTASFGRAIEFDNLIATDKQKYSIWMLGLATAGFALALTQSDKLLARTLLTADIGRIVIEVSAAIFFVSSLVGAIVVRCVDRQIDFSRQSMTLLLRQELILSLGQSASDDASPEILIKRVTGCEYLDDENRMVFQDARAKSQSAGTWAERMLHAQQILVALGYIAIFVAAVG